MASLKRKVESDVRLALLDSTGKEISARPTRTHYWPLSNTSYCVTCDKFNPDTKTCSNKGDTCGLRTLFKRSKIARVHRDAHKKVRAEIAAERAKAGVLREQRVAKAITRKAGKSPTLAAARERGPMFVDFETASKVPFKTTGYELYAAFGDVCVRRAKREKQNVRKK